MSLYNKYRPKTFGEMKGNYTFIEKLLSKPEHPHCFLFQGGSGLGKTTAARIVASIVKAEDIDVEERNAADFNGVDSTREMVSSLSRKPFGKSALYIIDEAHRLTAESQNCLLKPFEDTPSHVYFILCTTEPNKIIKTLQSRCTIVEFKPLTEDDLYDILKKIRNEEDVDVPRDILMAIIQASGGSARKALVDLEHIVVLPKEDMLASISEESGESVSIIELCRALYSSPLWGDIQPILKVLKEQKEDAEKIRRTVLAYGNTLLMATFNERCLRIMSLFQEHTYDTGFSGIIIMCGNACNLQYNPF